MKRLFWKPEKLFVLAGLALSVILCRVFQIPCLFKAVLGIPCATCGMTRAYIALLHFDLRSAFAYHSLFWAIPLLVLLFWFDGKLFPKAWQNIALLSSILALFLFRWIILLL